MTALRVQHLIPATIVLALALVVAGLSFTREPAGAFLFPRIVSVAFVVLAAWNFARAAMGLARVGGGIDARTLKNLLPGLAVMAVLVLVAARGLGFYTGSALAFLAIYSIYDPKPIASAEAWIKRLVVTLAFMSVIYVLFALLLKVQMPSGAFF